MAIAEVTAEIGDEMRLHRLVIDLMRTRTHSTCGLQVHICLGVGDIVGTVRIRRGTSALIDASEIRR